MIGIPRYLPRFVIMGIFKELDMIWLSDEFTLALKRVLISENLFFVQILHPVDGIFQLLL